jgi:hypothetical protein
MIKKTLFTLASAQCELRMNAQIQFIEENQRKNNPYRVEYNPKAVH